MTSTTNIAAPPQTLTLGQWIGFFAMLFGNFMAILDISIVSSSLLTIQAGLSASTADMAWVQSAYLIAEVIAIPLSGFLSRLLSTRGMFLMSAAGFTAMSLASAFAWDINSMIVFRVFQGFFGGGMVPTTTATIFLLFPKEKTMKAQVMVGLVSTLGPVVGPTLGGYLTELYSWHWLFLINVVPGILVCLTVAKFVNVDKPDYSLLAKLDYVGLLGMAAFLGGVEYVLEEGPKDDWFSDLGITVVALLSAVGALLFFYRAFTAAQPVVDLSPFKNRNFSFANAFGFLLGLGLFGSSFVLPLFLGQVRGYNSRQIGELMAVSGAVMFFAAPLVGRLVGKVPKRVICGVGTLLVALSCFMNAHLTPEWGFAQMFWAQVVRGVGLIMCFIPLTALALGDLPPHQVKSASALFSLLRNLGGAFGLAFLNTELSHRQAYHWQQLIPAINLGRPEVLDTLSATSASLASAGLAQPQASALASLAQRVQTQALVLTYNDLFLLIATLSAATAILILFLKETKATNSPGAH